MFDANQHLIPAEYYTEIKEYFKSKVPLSLDSTHRALTLNGEEIMYAEYLYRKAKTGSVKLNSNSLNVYLNVAARFRAGLSTTIGGVKFPLENQSATPEKRGKAGGSVLKNGVESRHEWL